MGGQEKDASHRVLAGQKEREGDGVERWCGRTARDSLYNLGEGRQDVEG
jgi:hypothetical protein